MSKSLCSSSVNVSSTGEAFTAISGALGRGASRGIGPSGKPRGGGKGIPPGPFNGGSGAIGGRGAAGAGAGGGGRGAGGVGGAGGATGAAIGGGEMGSGSDLGAAVGGPGIGSGVGGIA